MQTLFDEFAETLLTARTGVEAFVASKDWTLWRIAGACRFTWAPQTPFFETGEIALLVGAFIVLAAFFKNSPWTLLSGTDRRTVAASNDLLLSLWHTVLAYLCATELSRRIKSVDSVYGLLEKHDSNRAAYLAFAFLWTKLYETAVVLFDSVSGVTIVKLVALGLHIATALAWLDQGYALIVPTVLLGAFANAVVYHHAFRVARGEKWFFANYVKAFQGVVVVATLALACAGIYASRDALAAQLTAASAAFLAVRYVASFL